jgi:hypothetical protein
VVWRNDLKADKDAQVFSMGCGDGVILVCWTDATVQCLDVKTGRMGEWVAKLRGAENTPVPPPAISGGLALYQHTSDRRLTCIDLGTGRLAFRQMGHSGSVHARMTDAGLLVTLRNGTLSVREARRDDNGRPKFTKPLWARQMGSEEGPAILDVDEGRAVVAPDAGSKLTVHSLSGDGKPLAAVDVRGFPRSDGLPVHARLAGDGLYVVCSVSEAGPRGRTLGRYSVSRGLSLQKIDLPSGRAAWTHVLDSDPRSYYRCMPLVLTKDHVILAACQGAQKHSSMVRVFERSTGRPEGEPIYLSENDEAEEQTIRRLHAVGAPALVGGRLCLETAEGFVVLGGE